jgi:hypothetical protein
MGADMLVTALVIDRGQSPDFDAARVAIDSIRASDIEVPDEFTGGLSTGDAPTNLFDTFTRLYAAPAVLAAAGFEVAP